MRTQRPNRRQAERIQLVQPLIARIGTVGVLLIDVSDRGARIEHYAPWTTAGEKLLRLEWGENEVASRCRVVSTRVHRFASGDDGLTVYQSGLQFQEESGPFVETVKRMISAQRAGSLVEQVANARGFVAPNLDAMPIFRGGGLASNNIEVVKSQKLNHLVPDKKIVGQAGFLRCALIRNSYWMRKWTLDPSQPLDGFTISASEPAEQVDQLCQNYLGSNSLEREFIRTLAVVSLENSMAESSSGIEAPGKRFDDLFKARHRDRQV